MWPFAERPAPPDSVELRTWKLSEINDDLENSFQIMTAPGGQDEYELWVISQQDWDGPSSLLIAVRPDPESADWLQQVADLEQEFETFRLPNMLREPAAYRELMTTVAGYILEMAEADRFATVEGLVSEYPADPD